MLLTVFRSRLREEARAEYMALAGQMAQLAETMPGFLSRKTFVAEDGERLILVEVRGREIPEELVAKRAARER